MKIFFLKICFPFFSFSVEMGHCHIKHCNHPFVNYHFLIFNLRKDNSFFGNEQVYYSNLISASLVKFALYEICSAEGLSLPRIKQIK